MRTWLLHVLRYALATVDAATPFRNLYRKTKTGFKRAALQASPLYTPRLCTCRTRLAINIRDVASLTVLEEGDRTILCLCTTTSDTVGRVQHTIA